jgi:hypothetical protein
MQKNLLSREINLPSRVARGGAVDKPGEASARAEARELALRTFTALLIAAIVIEPSVAKSSADHREAVELPICNVERAQNLFGASESDSELMWNERYA